VIETGAYLRVVDEDIDAAEPSALALVISVAMAPGPVATELFLKGKTEAQIEQFGKLVALERLGRPEDMPSWSRSWPALMVAG
jgi:hypothetical protein